MKKKLSLILLAASAAPVQAEDKYSLHYMQYQEYDDRVEVGDAVVSVEKNFGVDWTLKADAGYDSVSGASPALQGVLPSSQLSSTDLQNFNSAQGQTDQTLLGYDPNGEYRVKHNPLTDTRTSASLSVTWRDAVRREYTYGVAYSSESDYVSRALSGQILWYADSRKNRSYTLGASLQADTSSVFETGYGGEHDEDLNVLNLEVGLSQIISSKSFATFTGFATFSDGYLSNHYLTIIREVDLDGNGQIGVNELFLAADSRPEKRIAGGFVARYNKQWRNDFTTLLHYRYYSDDWDIASHTVSATFNWKPTPKLTVIPNITWYQQTAANFYRDAESDDRIFAKSGFGSSDIRLGDYDATTLALGLSYQVLPGLSFDFSVSDYQQSNDFSTSWWISGFTLRIK